MQKALLLSALLAAQFTLLAGSLTPKIPYDGQTNVGINTQIVLQADVALAHGTDSCFLNGEYLAPSSVASTMAIFKPGQLLYATTYTVEVRDGAFQDKSGNPIPGCTYSFTTASPQAKVFDAIVAADGSGDYTSIRAAVKAAPTNRTAPWLIFVKNGTYTELVRVASNQPYISIVGEDPEKTVLKFSITSNSGHERDNANFTDAEGQGPVLSVKGTDFYLHNISVIDSWGYDNQAGPQALAFGSYADRITLFNTTLRSYQDTWQTGSDEHRAYARNCYVEGAVDFIYCSGDLVLDSCTIGLCRNGSVIVAPSHGEGVKYGYVFRNCDIVSSKPGTARTNNSFGRPWHNAPRASFINSTLSKDISFSAGGWTDHMGGLPAVFAEYNTMDYKGNPVDLSQRISRYYKETDGVRTYATAKNILTKDEADFLTAANVLSGKDGWRPERITQEIPAPRVTIKGKSIEWPAQPQAICYEILRNGAFETFVTETSYTPAEGELTEYQVRAVSYYGTLGKVSNVPFVDALEEKSIDGAVDVCLQGGWVSVTGFRGRARAEFYALDGRCAGQCVLEEGRPVQVPVQGVFFLKLIANDMIDMVKCFNGN